MADIRAQLAAAGRSSKAVKPKLPGFPKAGAAAAAAAAAGVGGGAGVALGQLGSSSAGDDELWYEDEEEDWDEDESTPAFQITFDETGKAVSWQNMAVY